MNVVNTVGMLGLRFTRPRIRPLALPQSQTDKAIDGFLGMLGMLVNEPEPDYALAYEAIQAARANSFTRCQQITRWYHNAQQWQM